MAIRDANYGMQTIIQEFCPILGLMITKEDTPELYTLLQDVGATCDSISDRAKKKYSRTRPFVYYNQPTLVPEQEEEHITNGSYPSGHTVLGWTMALLLSDIIPLLPTHCWLAAMSMARAALLPDTTGRATWMPAAWAVRCFMPSCKATSVSESSLQRPSRSLGRRLRALAR